MIPSGAVTQSRMGNTLIEYAGVGVCVLLVLIASLQLLGGNLNEWFSGLKQNMDADIQATSVANAKAAQAKSAYETAQAEKAAKDNLIPSLQSTCTLGQACISEQNYNPAQTVGANGIDLVDQYAEIINQLAQKAHAAPNSDLTFALMLDDLAADGHNVAGDERAVLTMYAKYGSSFDFSIKDRYAATLNRAIDYLNQHPQVLAPQDAQTLRTASNNITQQVVAYLGSSNPGAVTNTSINQKFTDTGGNQGATYVDHQATTICDTGGSQCQ